MPERSGIFEHQMFCFFYLYIALLVYKQVFRFKVSVDQVQSMQVLKSQDDLSCVEPGMRFTANKYQQEGEKEVRSLVV